MGSLSAHAGVVQGGYSVGGDRQGYAGEQVSLSIDESAVSGFEFGQLLVTYDSTLLEFDSAGVNGLVYASPVPLSDVNGLATVSLFLTTTGPSALSGPLQLFTLLFHILGTAPPGATDIDFAFDPSGGFVFGSDGVYDRLSLTGTITVLPQIAAVPIVGTLPLALTALALLALSRRQCRTRHSRHVGTRAIRLLIA